MHLLSCENPQRVYNKYIGEYVWTTCGKCNSCRNARAFKWTDALERERLLHPYCLFVTLTYSDNNLPIVFADHFPAYDLSVNNFRSHDAVFVSNRIYDDICIPFQDFKPEDMTNEEISLFEGIYQQFNGIPYACYSDIQYFHKRLNKWFFKNVTNKFENFRFFLVSEFGSTTLRPHFHGIYFVDDKRVAQRFEEGVSSCWKLGIIDSKYVESSACAYVAQYVNKFADLPLFYKTTRLKPYYRFSKNPIIGCEDFYDSSGVSGQCSEDISKIFDQCLVETCSRRKANSTDFILRPLHKSIEDRLFPKCPFFKQISDSLRVQLYSISSRFGVEGFKKPFEVFRRNVLRYLHSVYSQDWIFQRFERTEFSDFLYKMFYEPYMSEDDEECNRAYGWLRRLYYLSRKILKNMSKFHVSLLTYVNKIKEYYNKKEIWLMSKFYEFQASYKGLCEDLALMYPEYLYQNGYSADSYIDCIGLPDDVLLQREDGREYAFSNKKTHFKNAYLDSLAFKASYKTLFINLKTYYYAKKCYEVIETIAA